MDEDFSQPPPMTIWDLMQLMFVIALYSAIVRLMLDQEVGAAIAFTAIVAVDLVIFGIILLWAQWNGRAARRRRGTILASLPNTQEHIRIRKVAFYITLLASLPYQALLLTFAANFRALGPAAIGVVLSIHLLVAVATLLYWRNSRRRGAVFCDNGVLLHGSQFLPWRGLNGFRYGEVRRRLVLYENGYSRFRYHEFEVSPEAEQQVLGRLEKHVKRSL